MPYMIAVSLEMSDEPNIFPFAQSNVLASEAASFDNFRTIKKNYSMLVRFEIID